MVSMLLGGISIYHLVSIGKRKVGAGEVGSPTLILGISALNTTVCVDKEAVMRKIVWIAVLLAGCGPAQMYSGMSAEQITAAAKDNKAVYQCTDGEFPVTLGGTAKIKSRSMIVDANVIRNGAMKAKTCDEIEFSNDSNKPVLINPPPASITPVRP